MDSKKIESLADYCRRIRNEKNISTTDVEAASRKGGLKGISNGYVSQIENGYIKNVSPEKLKALARGLGVTEEEIFAISRGININGSKVVNERFAAMSFGYEGVPEEKKFRIDPLIDLLEQEIKKNQEEQKD